MLKIIIKIVDEDNEEHGVICGTGSNFGILNLEGVESLEKNIITSPMALSDGEVYQGQKKQPRNITIEFEALNNNRNEEYRDYFVHFLNNDKRKKIIVTMNNTTRKIYGYVTNWSFSNPYIYEPIRVNISLTCPNPLFLNMSDFGQNIASINNRFAFPLTIPQNRGVVMGYKTFNKKLNIENNGDYTTGIIIIFKAVRGTVVTPSLTKISTNEFLKVNDTMEKGDTIRIETNLGKKTVFKNDINISNKLTRDSTYFQVTKGRNIIEYNAEEGYTNLDVYIYYTPTYGGI